MSAALGFIQAAAQYGINSILVKPKRALGLFTMQVVVEEVHTDELEITDHPVEQGAIISDHAFKRPAQLVIRGGWSDSPSVSGLFSGIAGGLGATITGIKSLVSGGSASQVREQYQKLLKLQASREVIEVFTGKRNYTDMLIQSLVTTTDRSTENSLFLTVTLRQVIKARTQLIASAPAAKQAAPALTASSSNLGPKQPAPTTKFFPPGAGP